MMTPPPRPKLNPDRSLAGDPVVIPPDATEAEVLRLRFPAVPPAEGTGDREAWDRLGLGGGAPAPVAGPDGAGPGCDVWRGDDGTVMPDRFLAGDPVIIPADATEAERLRLRFPAVPPPEGSAEREAWDRLGMGSTAAAPVGVSLGCSRGTAGQ